MRRFRVNATTRYKLKQQEHECCYCGKRIRRFQKVGLAYDNNGLAHLKCCSLGRA